MAGWAVQVPEAEVHVVGAINMADGVAKIEEGRAAWFAVQIVGLGVVVAEDDVVLEDEGAVAAAGIDGAAAYAGLIPALRVEGAGSVGDEGVVGEEGQSALPEVERDGVAGAAEIAEMGVVRRRGSLYGSRHPGAVGDDDVVDEDGRIFVRAPLEGASVVAVSRGVGDLHGALTGVDVSEIEAVLHVVAEGGVVDVRGQTGSRRGSDSVSLSGVALAVAGRCSGVGISLVASAPLDRVVV